MSCNKKLITLSTALLLAAFVQVLRSAQTAEPAKPVTASTPAETARVFQVDVFTIKELTSFRTAVTQEVIEKNYEYKYSVKWSYADQLSALIHEQIANTKETAPCNYDFCYAVVEYDEKDNRLLSLYIDNLSDDGLLNSKPVHFEPALKKLLREWHPSTMPTGNTQKN